MDNQTLIVLGVVAAAAALYFVKKRKPDVPIKVDIPLEPTPPVVVAPPVVIPANPDPVFTIGPFPPAPAPIDFPPFRGVG